MSDYLRGQYWKMIIAELTGGLGNQMFQYAAALYIMKNLGLSCEKDLKLDISFLKLKKGGRKFVRRDFGLNIFKISTQTASFFDVLQYKVPQMNHRGIYHIVRFLKHERNVFSEESCCLDDIPNHAYFSGYWQNAKYLEKVNSEVKTAFQFREPLRITEHINLRNFIRCTENAVCISFRRGDYVGHKNLGFLTMLYYETALKKLEAIVQKPLSLFVFSDDIEWCKKNFLQKKHKIYYMDTAMTGGDQRVDLELMENCKYFIIPNSTFHFWGAYLSQSEDKIVFVPNKYSNLQKEHRCVIWPSDWIGLDSF